MEHFGLSGAAVQEYQPSFTDTMVSWTTNPYVATILLVIGIGGMVVEIITAGFGIAGILSLLAFVLYFGGHIADGLAYYWVVFLFIFGVVMLIVDSFIPVFGVFGVAGLLAIVASIVLAAASVKSGLVMLAVAWFWPAFCHPGFSFSSVAAPCVILFSLKKSAPNWATWPRPTRKTCWGWKDRR